MQIAETVTFGGSGLDRCASLRRDVAGLAEALACGTVFPLWRGKPLLDGEHPAWVPAGHPVLAMAGPPVFLGIDDGVPRFAADLSDWSPEAGADAPEAGFFDQTVQHHPAMTGGQGFVELRGAMTLLTPREAELVATAKAVLQWHRSHGFCSTCGARSEMAQGGWQRTCPACGAQHFPRTDPVVIMLVTRGNSVLLGRSPGWPEGMFSLLAGFVEPGETLEAAVRREVLGKPASSAARFRTLPASPGRSRPR
jgi:NAD+ diphosphatase